MVLSIDPKIVLSLVDVFSIVLVAVILLCVIVILVMKKKKIDKKIKEQEEKIKRYESKIKSIKELEPNEESLQKLTKVAKEFFKEKYDLSTSLTYLELAEKFKNLKNSEEKTDFCKIMSDLLYSGRRIKEEEIKNAINIFANIIQNTKRID